MGMLSCRYGQKGAKLVHDDDDDGSAKEDLARCSGNKVGFGILFSISHET
jgi:hypothetical protein